VTIVFLKKEKNIESFPFQHRKYFDENSLKEQSHYKEPV